MKIEQFEVIDRCLFWKEKKILVVGDMHLGYEEFLMESGTLLPKTQMDETLNLFKNIFARTKKLKKIILLGDVKHYFAGILQGEFEDFLNLARFLKKNLMKNGRIIITKGNHDNILSPIVRNYSDIELVDFYTEEGVIFLHGDKFSLERAQQGFDKKNKLVVLGHFHPAIYISEDSKKEKYKCFLSGKGKNFNKKLIFVPSFFPLVEGTDILGIKFEDLKKFEVYVLSGGFNEVLDFGQVKRFR